MILIFVWSEDHVEGTSNFNTWKERVLNIIEEHNLNGYVSIVEENPTTNEGRINQSPSMGFFIWLMEIMSMIISLKNGREVLKHSPIFSGTRLVFKKRGTSKQRLCTLKRRIFSSCK